MMDVSRSEFLFDLTIKLNACNAEVLGLLSAGKLNQAESVLRSKIHDVGATLAADVDDGTGRTAGADVTVDDIDALLAAAGTVPEPSAQLLLWQLARGGGRGIDIDINQLPEDAFDTWHRYLKWRDGPGRRIVCRDCDTVFVRDRKNGQRCTNCRVTYRLTCVGCGEVFAALHHAFKRCPPCREVWLRR